VALPGIGRLASLHGIDLLAYSIMGNHLHLVVRLRPDRVRAWTSGEVARHALAVLPVRSGPTMEPLAVTPAVVERYAENPSWIADQRQRLASPSWLLRVVKQEIARRANGEDGCTGHFWERRFTSVVLLDAAAVLACMVYVDLNPLRAGLVGTPEESLFTSIRHRAYRSAVVPIDGQQDDGLGPHLLPMTRCAPPASEWEGEGVWSLGEADYVALVRETAVQATGNGRAGVATAFAGIRRHGIEPAAWVAAMTSGGSMGGSVIGSPDSRQLVRQCGTAVGC
jgi:hypothetical protein